MKFRQQFEVNELYVCTKYRGNKLPDLGFRTQKPTQKFGVKSGHIQKRLKYGKIFHIFMCFNIPFYPNQFGRNEVLSFFFLFYFF